MSKIIGIDLGTSNSCVSVMEGNEAVIIVNSEGMRTTPSIVAYSDDGEKKVGNSAKRQSITNPEKTISSIKRFMGETYKSVEKEAEKMPYSVKEGKNGGIRVKIGNKEYTPQEISALILQNLKKTAEDYIGETVTEAVITVPAYFSDSQRQATKEAGKIAGLDVKRIINEPTAASLAYGVDKKKNEKLAVFDLGGGTFDISILELSDGVFEVLSTNGDTHLGGDDFDNAIMEWLKEEFINDNGEVKFDSMAVQRLKESAEAAKVELSSQKTTEINLPYFIPVDGTPRHLVKTLSRAKFESLTNNLVDRVKEPCKKALKDANLTKDDISEVLLVGGSTRIPSIQEFVKEFFGKEPNKGINPDEAVALGAAIQGGVLSGEVNDVLLLDVTPLSLGIETMGGVMTKLIESNTTIPTKQTKIFSTAEDNQPGVSIRVLQGERPMADDNKQVGIFELDGILPAKKGVPQIEVTFDIDANGILNVSAKDKGTGKEQSIRIEASSGLSDEEIERMREDAKANEEEDLKRREKADTLNEAESMIFNSDKQIEALGDKITEDEKKKVNDAIESLKESLKDKTDIDNIREKMNSYSGVWHDISTRIYGDIDINKQ